MNLNVILIGALLISGCSFAEPDREKMQAVEEATQTQAGVQSAAQVNNKAKPAPPAVTQPKSLGKNCTNDLPDSQKGSPCWDLDIDGDGKTDRIRIAAIGEFAYVVSISEIPDDGDTFLPEIALTEEIIGVSFSSDGRERAVNLKGADKLYLVDKKTVSKLGMDLKGCLIAGENPIAVAQGKSENVVLTYEDKILTARRCSR
jgi:hypothetical protein